MVSAVRRAVVAIAARGVVVGKGGDAERGGDKKAAAGARRRERAGEITRDRQSVQPMSGHAARRWRRARPCGMSARSPRFLELERAIKLKDAGRAPLASI